MENNSPYSTPQLCSHRDSECEWLALEQAGVPDDPRWKTLILHAKYLNHHKYLNCQQRARLQSLFLGTLQEKDFSEGKYIYLMEENYRTIISPSQQQLQYTVDESKNLLMEVRAVLEERKGDISNLGNNTISAIENGTDARQLIGMLRMAIHDMVETFQQDIDQLETISQTDALTGLNNRRAFDEKLRKEIRTACKLESPLSLLLIDIDDFKKFNDSFGHRVGDQALLAVAGNIRRYVDTFQGNNELNIFPGRYGGDEFAIILPHLVWQDALAFAEGLRRTMEDYHFVIREKTGAIFKSDISITISIGVGLLRPELPGDHASALIDVADAGLYAAKLQGRNCVRPGWDQEIE